VARNVEASVPCVGHPDITQSSSLITSTPTGVRGLVRAGSHTGPIQAARRHHPVHPPSPPDCRRQGQAPAKPMARWPPWS
jgi:hypothetical protein